MMMSASQVAHAVHGVLIGDDAMLNGISINTREDCDGRLFVALKGENFDSHDFAHQAELAGAGAVVVERELVSALPRIRVNSTHQALKDLAAWWRKQFAIPVVGVTGSVGKTTVKEMLGSIMAELGDGVVTKGNLNNEIGVPLTLLRLAEAHRYAVIEMGMNHAGEISRLTDISRPTVALVNNAGAAHLEGLGSVEAVANAKGEIFSGLTEDGVAVINIDDDFSGLWKTLSKNHKQITFGLDPSADVTGSYQQAGTVLQMQISAFGETTAMTLNSFGEHSARNALAAVATALAVNLPLSTIIRGLEKYSPVQGRLQSSQVGKAIVFDDTYNANPTSMQAAIRVLENYDANLLIVGDMAELGASAELEHQRLGEFARLHGVDQVWACGEFAEKVIAGFGVQGEAFRDQKSLLDHLSKREISALAILVKGSRSAKMEHVVKALKQQLESDAAVARGAD